MSDARQLFKQQYPFNNPSTQSFADVLKSQPANNSQQKRNTASSNTLTEHSAHLSSSHQHSKANIKPLSQNSNNAIKQNDSQTTKNTQQPRSNLSPSNHTTFNITDNNNIDITSTSATSLNPATSPPPFPPPLSSTHLLNNHIDTTNYHTASQNCDDDNYIEMDLDNHTSSSYHSFKPLSSFTKVLSASQHQPYSSDDE